MFRLLQNRLENSVHFVVQNVVFIEGLKEFDQDCEEIGHFCDHGMDVKFFQEFSGHFFCFVLTFNSFGLLSD